MEYLNKETYRAIDGEAFRSTKPFPYLNPKGALTDEAFEALRVALPDISLFTKTVGVPRAYGQKPHDRYELKYTKELSLDPVWQEFIDVIFGEAYQKEMARILGTKHFTTRVQWQYAYAGCSVSPHCDSPNKLGSQIFYFNTSEDWDTSWGGETLVLDGGGRSCSSAPELHELAEVARSVIVDNRSFIFMRNHQSWHAVRELTPPEGKMRRIFTVVFDRKPTLWSKIRNKIRALLR